MWKNLEDKKETNPGIPLSNKQQWPYDPWMPGDHVTHTATPEQHQQLGKCETERQVCVLCFCVWMQA